MSGLSVVVRVAAVDLGAVRTVEDAASLGDVVLAAVDPDPRARPMLAGLARRHGTRMLECGGGEGAARNAAVRAGGSAHVLLVDAGDRIDATAVAALRDRLRDGAAIAAAPVRLERVDGVASVEAPPLPGGIATAPDAVPSAYLFARAAFDAVGGFAEDLAGLCDADFWLRASAHGGIAVVPGPPLVTRPLAVASVAPRPPAAAFDAFFARHAGTLARDPAATLGALERRMADLAAAHDPLLATRAAGLAEVAALDAEIRGLEEEARALGIAAVDWGDLGRLSPLSREWGYDRGTPADRPYIEAFLAAHAADVRGAVLEIQEADYTRRFGGARVTRSDVLDVTTANPRATVLADLRHADAVAEDTYDCVIVTQTLHVVDDAEAALREVFRILRPGGVMLATFPAASRVCVEYGPEGDFWRVTEAGARRLVGRAFPAAEIATTAYGNVKATAGFLYGLGAHELSAEDLAPYDPYFPMVIGVRARKPSPAADAARPLASRRAGLPRAAGGAILLYHRVDDPPRDVHRLCVPPREFRAQLEMLRAEWNVVPLAELARWAAAGRDASGLLALTFDDGYRDNLEVASPILAELELPATFFATTEHLAGGGEYWWDFLERVLLSSRPVPPALDLDGFWTGGPLDTSTREARARAHGLLHPRLVTASLEERRAILGRLAAWTDAPPPLPRARPLDAAGVAALAGRPGHAVGAHGTHHLALGSQPAAAVEREVGEGTRRLAEILGRPVEAFAYPYGDVSDAAVTAVAAAGLGIAVTCEEAPLRAGADLLRLPRLEAKADGVEALEERLWRLLR